MKSKRLRIARMRSMLRKVDISLSSLKHSHDNSYNMIQRLSRESIRISIELDKLQESGK